MKKLTTHLQYHWWLYLVCAVVVIFVWCTIFQVLARPSSDEAIRILYVGEYWDTEPLEQALLSHLSHSTSQEISVVEIAIFAEQTDMLLPILMAKQYEYDLVILSEPFMQEGIGQNAFGMPIPAQMRTQAHPLGYYTETVGENILPFAFILHNGTTVNRFASFYPDAPGCYLFVSPQSVNCDRATGYGQSGHDAAIQTIEFLLEIP